MALRREFRPALLSAAPLAGAILVMFAGAMLIASGATPSSPERFMRLSMTLPALVIETSHFASSVLGLVLVMLAFGLRSRLDAAWAASVAVLFLTALLALAKGMIWEEALILAAIGAFLAPLRAAFPRKAALSQMEVSPGWLLSAAAAALERLRQPIGKQHGLHHLAVFQHGDDYIGLLHRCCKGVMHMRPQRRQGLCLGAGAVPHMGLQASFAQAFGHRQAHQADSDKSNAHDQLLLHQ